MINYNPRDWFTFIFRVYKVETLQKLFPMLLAMALYTGLVALLEQEWLKLTHEPLSPLGVHLKNLNLLHSTLAFVISLLLVFRTNTAYDRWWEGRRLWGSLVNNSRNLALKLKAMLPEEDTESRQWFELLIPRFAYALREHLMSDKTRTELFDELPEGVDIDQNKHIPNQISLLLFQKVNALYKDGIITGNQLIVLNAELQSFADICGACERIKNTPIPFSYSVFMKKFIFFYIMTLPFGYVFSLGYLAIPVVVFIFYVLASLELIAEEIEDPFGSDANDLPTQKICINIEKHVKELLD